MLKAKDVDGLQCHEDILHTDTEHRFRVMEVTPSYVFVMDMKVDDVPTILRIILQKDGAVTTFDRKDRLVPVSGLRIGDTVTSIAGKREAHPLTVMAVTPEAAFLSSNMDTKCHVIRRGEDAWEWDAYIAPVTADGGPTDEDDSPVIDVDDINQDDVTVTPIEPEPKPKPAKKKKAKKKAAKKKKPAKKKAAKKAKKK